MKSTPPPFWDPSGTGDAGGYESALAEYKKFQRCLPELVDSASMLGDLTGKWVIFKDGWVYGLASYETERDAVLFSQQIFRNDPAVWIVVQVDLEKHQISPLHLLGDALSQLEFEAEDGAV